MSQQQDRNFDALAERFESRVYDSVKGRWRLTLLKEDLQSLHDNKTPLTVWDAGCGLGQMGLWLAQAGHQLTLCDISAKMLDEAKQRFADAGIAAEFHHQSAQEFEPSGQFDLVLCHAVLEWLADPLPSLIKIIDAVKPGGTLSLLFYNRNAMVYSNVLRGGWRLKPIIEDSYIGLGNKLTPPNPQYPYEVIETLQANGFEVTQQTGIRVFNDYLSHAARDISDEDELFTLERRYCRTPGFRDMGRYIHLLCQR
jgi:S-adenosylmethionine-dependent methyltransferase